MKTPPMEAEIFHADGEPISSGIMRKLLKSYGCWYAWYHLSFL